MSLVSLSGSTIINDACSSEIGLLQFASKEEVKKISKKATKVFGSDYFSTTLLTGGRGTSRILKLSTKSCEVICRVVDRTRPSFFLSTETEIANLRLVDALGIAPRLYYAKPTSDIILMDCVKNQRLTDSDLCEKNYSELASKLKRLHDGPELPTKTNFFDDFSATIADGNRVFMPQIALDCLEQVQTMQVLLQKHEDLVPSHKDLHSNNVLFDGKTFHFIDWEMAAMADRYIDLACASIFFVFNQKDEDRFLQSYFGRELTENEQAHFFLMKQTCLCLYGFRLLRRLTGKESIDLSKKEVSSFEGITFKQFALENYNGCSKEFSVEELILFPFMFLREAKEGFESERYQKSLQALS